MALIRHLQGLGQDDTTDASSGSIISAPWSDTSTQSMPFSSLSEGANPESAGEAVGSAISEGLSAPASAVEGTPQVAAAIGSAINPWNWLPWWAWVGLAGVAYLAWHHEFGRPAHA